MACCAACAKGSELPVQCLGGACTMPALNKTLSGAVRKPAPSFNPFLRGGLTPRRAPLREVIYVEEEHVHLGDEPTNGPNGKRGLRVEDYDGDYFAQEPDDYRPTGVLPGGLTAAEWNVMSEAERTAYVNRVATTDAARSALIASAAREGLTGLSAIILAIYAGEAARATSAADREAQRLRSRDAIELATIQANRDIEIARAGGSALTTTPRPTTGAQWDALTPAQQLAAGPRPPGLSTKAKWAIGVGSAVGGVALLGGIAYAVTK